MPFEITMPQLGLTMEKGSIVEWLVDPGDRIEPGQEIFQVETDKAVVAVEAREAGTLARVLVPAGEEVPVGTVLAVGVVEGETLPDDWQPSTQAAAEPSPAQVETALVPKPMERESFQASWKARRLAHEAGVDIEAVTGSGPGGRVVAEDVLARRAARAAAPTQQPQATPVAANLAAALGLDLSRLTGSGSQGRITQEDVLHAAAAIIQQREGAAPPSTPGPPQVVSTTPLKGVRRIVSEGMAASARVTARVTLFREVDASQFVRFRERFIAQGVRVSYNDLLVHICAVALGEFPAANARLGDNQIEYLDRVNVGLAVDTERGLLVPVVHHADRLTLPQIAAETARLVADARAGRSQLDDLGGGTFTITNLGMFGVEGFTPVINLPECCILGVGQIVRKPVVIDQAPHEGSDTVAVRPTLTLSLAFDHRVLDGAPAARFLDRIAHLVEDPLLLLTSET